MASGEDRSKVFERQRVSVNMGSSTMHVTTHAAINPQIKMLGSGQSIIFPSQSVEKLPTSRFENRKPVTDSTPVGKSLSLYNSRVDGSNRPKELQYSNEPSVIFESQFAEKQPNSCNENRSPVSDSASSRKSSSVHSSHAVGNFRPKELHYSNGDKLCKTSVQYSASRRPNSVQTFENRRPNDEESDDVKREDQLNFTHIFSIVSISNIPGEVNTFAKSMYREETNVLSQPGAIYFGKEQSNTFINDVEQNHNVTIEKEVIFGTCNNKVTKCFCKEGFRWFNCEGKELRVQKNRTVDDRRACVKVIPFLDEPQGQRFSWKNCKINMPVSPWLDGNRQERDTLQNAISSLFKKVKEGKETEVDILLAPLQKWSFDEYLNCFVKCSVKWLLDSSDELPRVVTLSAESMNQVTEIDGNIEKCVADLQKDLKRRTLPVIRVLKQPLDHTEADVLVNTTGPNLNLSIGNVSAAILKAVGKELQQECHIRYPDGITPDKIAITRGFNLMCKELFHITLPYYVDDKQCIESIRNAVLLCLEEASNHGHETIAFPIIGSGNMVYPIDLVRSEMFNSVERFKQTRQDTSLKEVRFVVYPKDTVLFENFKKEEVEQKKLLTELLSSRYNQHCEVKLKITGLKQNVTRARADLEAKEKDISAKDIAIQRQISHENILKFQVNDKATYKHDIGQYSGATGAVPKEQTVRRPFSWSKDAQNLDIYENGSLIIKVYQADILKVPTEGIVNAANQDLLHIGGIAGAIAKHAGKRLQTESRVIVQKEGPLKVSAVVSTSGGNLDFKHVLHAVGPRWRDYEPFTEINVQKCADHLKQTVLSCLMVAESKRLKTLVMPTISSGIFKVPKIICAVQYASAILEFDDRNDSLQEIHIVDLDSNTISIVQTIFYTMFTERKPAPNCLREFVDTPVKHTKKAKDSVKADESKNFKDSTFDKHYKQDNQSDDRTTVGQTTEVEDCVICMDKVTDRKKLKCGHIFCSECIDGYFRVKMVCPTCGKVCGTITGDQPPGIMRIEKILQPLTGHEDCKSIAITYSFQNGRQGPDHPKPSDFYKGISRTAFLPDTDEGREICAKLKVAFERRLVFTIGTSRTTGKEGVITWNDIHHKTDPRPYTQFGYPDATYLQRVQEELEVKGVTIDDVDDNFIDELRGKHFTRIFSV